MNAPQQSPYRHHSGKSHLAGTAPDLGLDPPRFLASLSPPPRARCGVDVERGVVWLMKQRGAPARDRTAHLHHAGDAHNSPDRSAQLRAQRAETAEELEAARHLVHRRYAWRGYENGDQEPPRATPQGAMHEITFVATKGAQTIGTITLGLDGPAGLLAENTHAAAIRDIRASGCQVCELTRLALAERVDSRTVLAALFSLAYAVGTARGVTDVVIEVNPRHVSFYTRVLGFAVAAGAKLCERVRAPSVLLRLRVEDLEQRLRLLAPSPRLSAQAA